MVLVVDFDQFIGRARAQSIPFGLRHIGIVELPLQPEFRRQFEPAATLDGDPQPPSGIFRHIACLGKPMPLWSIFRFSGFILRDGASRLLRMRFFLDPHGEERGNAARLEPRGHGGPS